MYGKAKEKEHKVSSRRRTILLYGSRDKYVSQLDKKSFSFKRGDTYLDEINTECVICKSAMNAKSYECQKCLMALTNKMMNNMLFSEIYENQTEEAQAINN